VYVCVCVCVRVCAKRTRFEKSLIKEEIIGEWEIEKQAEADKGKGKGKKRFD